MKKSSKNLRVVILTAVISAIFTCSITVAAVHMTAKEIPFTSTDETWNADNVEDAMNDLYVLGVTANNVKMESLGTGTSHSYDMKALYPDEYQNFTVDDFVVEVKSGSNSSKYSCSQCTLNNTDHTSSSSGSYSLTKNYDATTGIFTASASVSSSGSIQRYNGTFWSHSGTSALTSTVYFFKEK